MSNPAQSFKTEIAALYNRTAPLFDRVGPAMFARFGQRLTALADIPLGSYVLDVASGRGANLFPAAEYAGPSGCAIGIDLAAEMVRETAAEIRLRRLRHMAVLQMDGEQLAFRDASFDSVLCGFAIFFFTDLERTAAEWYRVCRSGGRVGVSLSAGSDSRWRWYNDLLLDFQDRYGFPVSPCARSGSLGPSDIRDVLLSAGWQDIQIMIEECECVYSSAEEWWAARWTHGSRYPLDAMPLDALQRFQAEVMEQLKFLQRTGEIREEFRLACVLGRK